MCEYLVECWDQIHIFIPIDFYLREYNADLLLSAFFVFVSLAAMYCGTYQESGLPRSEERVHLLVVIYAYGPCRRIWQENSSIAADWNHL
jgi:hypothetical protein